MSVLAAILIVLTQIATGSVAILLIPVTKGRSKLEIVGLGLALGTFGSMVSAVVLVNTPLASQGWFIPSLIVFGVAFLKRSIISERMKSLTVTKPELLGVIVGLLAGSALIITNWIRVPISVIRSGGSVDMYFFEALSRGISQFGPSESILMSDGSLRYHWFTYGWAGELTQVAGLEPFVALSRILPVVALIGVVLLSASWATRMQFGQFTSPKWVPSLAVLLIVVGGYTGALYGVVLNFDSPSQAFSSVWLLSLVIVFISGLSISSRASYVCYLALVLLLSSATTGGKASHVFIALTGFGVIAVSGLVLRKSWGLRALGLLSVAALGSLVTFFLVLSGVGLEENLGESVFVRASTWQGLDPVAGRWGPLLGTIALAIAVLARLAGNLWFIRGRQTRTSPEFLFAVGAFGAGVVALLALRGGINELWFLLAASAPLAVISAYGVGQAQMYLRDYMKKPFLWTLAIAFVSSCVSLILSMNWKFDKPPLEFFTWPGILFWLAVTSVWLLVILLAFAATRNARVAFGVAVSALVITSLLTRPAVLWTEARQINTSIGVVSPQESSTPTSVIELGGKTSELDLFEASAWLDAKTSREDQVATNDPYSAFIPALTGNQMYLAGADYQSGLGDVSQREKVEGMIKLSQQLSGSNLSQFAETLCDSGVKYAWITNEIGTPAQDPVFENQTVRIYSLIDFCEPA